MPTQKRLEIPKGIYCEKPERTGRARRPCVHISIATRKCKKYNAYPKMCFVLVEHDMVQVLKKCPQCLKENA